MMADYLKFFRDAHLAGLGLDNAQRKRLMNNAILSYCDARQLVPISEEQYRLVGDPFKCPQRWPLFAAGILIDAMDEGKPADIAYKLAFEDRAADCAWRPKNESERLKPGELLALITKEDREKAMELFGVGAVVKSIVADDAIRLLTRARD